MGRSGPGVDGVGAQSEWDEEESALALATKNPDWAIRSIREWKDQPFADGIALAVINTPGYEDEWVTAPTPGWWAGWLLHNFSQWGDSPWAEKVMLKACSVAELPFIIEKVATWVNAPFVEQVFCLLMRRIGVFSDEDTLDYFAIEDPSGGDPEERYSAHISGAQMRYISNLLVGLSRSEARNQPWVGSFLKGLVTKFPETVHDVSHFIKAFGSTPPVWVDDPLNDSLTALLRETKRRNGIRDTHSQHGLAAPSFEEGSPYALHGECPHSDVLPEDIKPKPAQLIRIGGVIRAFPPRDCLARDGRERCGLSTDKDRMVGPNQVQEYCRRAFCVCRIFRAGSAKKALKLQPGLNRSPAESRVFYD